VLRTRIVADTRPVLSRLAMRRMRREMAAEDDSCVRSRVIRMRHRNGSILQGSSRTRTHAVCSSPMIIHAAALVLFTIGIANDVTILDVMSSFRIAGLLALLLLFNGILLAENWMQGTLVSVNVTTTQVTPKKVAHHYRCVVSDGSLLYTVEYEQPVKIAIHDPVDETAAASRQ